MKNDSRKNIITVDETAPFAKIKDSNHPGCSALLAACIVKHLHLHAPQLILFEPRREKTGFLHVRKQRRR